MDGVLKAIAKGVIVSVQASQGEPLDDPEVLSAMAEAALLGGAVGVRMADQKNIRAFKKHHPRVPVIGITKPEKIPEHAHELVYITPGVLDVEEIGLYSDIVAMDATLRHRPGGEKLHEIIARVRQDYPDLLLMADVATLEEGRNAEVLGFDLISTTLSGYTTETLSRRERGPDFELLGALVEAVKTPVVMEGRIWQPEEVTRAFERGAHSVVIGSAITRPHEITRRFVQAVPASVG